MNTRNIYTVGGPVGHGVYIRRKADDELLELCSSAEYGHILTARQLGKSSLIERTRRQLNSENIRSVIIDLQAIGAGEESVTSENWYFGLLNELGRTLDLETDVYEWWQKHSRFGKTQRLIRFFEEVLLAEISSPVVIFFDEIDMTMRLKFTDDFFTAVRYMYNTRTRVPELKRLSIVFVGAADPADLIHDSQRTPFNIGQRVELTDFTFKEALPLAVGLGLADRDAELVLDWVMKWTNGHPYLTQKVCRTIADMRRASWSQDEVAAVIGDTFFDTEKPDNHLKYVSRDLIDRTSRRYLKRVLATYKTIRIGSTNVFDEEQSVIKNRLKLSGVVRREKLLGQTRKRSGQDFKTVGERVALRVRNPIYAEVFDEAWVNEHMPANWFARAKWAGLVTVALMLVLSGYAYKDQWDKREIAERNVAKSVNASLTEGDVGTYYTEYQKRLQPDGSLETPARTERLPDILDRGEITLEFFRDGALLLTRTGPNRGHPLRTWVSVPPTEIEPAPGKINEKDTSAQGADLSANGRSRSNVVLATLALPVSFVRVPVGRCLDPHPGPFRSWYGEKNGCWVAVYRQWQDGCTHYQWYNACYGYWDTHPNGAPKVYWTKCVH